MPLCILSTNRWFFEGLKALQPATPEPMLVIRAGLPRTGTGSLTLTILGYKTYHMKDAFENNEHSSQWASWAEGRLITDEVWTPLRYIHGKLP